MIPEKMFPIFFIGWAVLSLAGFLFFSISKVDVGTKRKYLPFFVVGSGALLVAFAYLMMGKAEILYFFGPAVLAISVLNIRRTKFCNSCGKMVVNSNILSTIEHCPKCGAKLE